MISKLLEKLSLPWLVIGVAGLIASLLFVLAAMLMVAWNSCILVEYTRAITLRDAVCLIVVCRVLFTTYSGSSKS